MRRPAFFLWCRIKTDSRAKPIVIPVPLYLLEDVLRSLFAIARIAGRWMCWQDKLGEHGPLLQQVLRGLPKLISELRWSGPFTLLEFNDPAAGTEVQLKLT